MAYSVPCHDGGMLQQSFHGKLRCAVTAVKMKKSKTSGSRLGGGRSQSTRNSSSSSRSCLHTTNKMDDDESIIMMRRKPDMLSSSPIGDADGSSPASPSSSSSSSSSFSFSAAPAPAVPAAEEKGSRLGRDYRPAAPPRIIHTCEPEILNVPLSDFMRTVQLLTGRTPTPPSPSPSPSPHAPAHGHFMAAPAHQDASHHHHIQNQKQNETVVVMVEEKERERLIATPADRTDQNRPIHGPSVNDLGFAAPLPPPPPHRPINPPSNLAQIPNQFQSESAHFQIDPPNLAPKQTQHHNLLLDQGFIAPNHRQIAPDQNPLAKWQGSMASGNDLQLIADCNQWAMGDQLIQEFYDSTTSDHPLESSSACDDSVGYSGELEWTESSAADFQFDSEPFSVDSYYHDSALIEDINLYNTHDYYNHNLIDLIHPY